jgi:ABC-type nitrate/sulfonate/bicarbonate transport system substrate-binding protein
MLLASDTARRLVAAITLGAILVACGSTAGSTSPSSAPLKLSIGLAATVPWMGIVHIAKLKGYFTEEGLDANVSITGAANTLTSVVSGQSDLGATGPTAAFGPVRDGKETSIVYSGNALAESAAVAATSKISSLGQCSRMATSPPGTSSYGWAVWYKKNLGAKYEIVQINDTPSILASVISGTSDCAVTTLSAFLPSANAGKLHFLYDPRDRKNMPAGFPADLPGGGFWGLKVNLKSKKEALTRFFRAILKATAYVTKTSSSEIATLLRKDADWQPLSQDAITQIYEAGKPFLFPNGGYIAPSIWPSYLDYTSSAGQSFVVPSDSKWSYAERVDMSYFTAAGGKATK